MKLKIYQVDAFASQVFAGNAAAVCPLEHWLSESLMQKIAAENNLSETAFFVREAEHYSIRWFTPNKEVSLCGHATLASAHVIFNHLSDFTGDTLYFMSKSGELRVSQSLSHSGKPQYNMDFPASAPTPCDIPEIISSALSLQALACLRAEDYFLIYETEEQIKNLQADFQKLSQIDLRGVCISAPSTHYDFVSRFFAPKYGIDEDPVTGSSFTQLAPYWSEQLEKTSLSAKQISNRGGEVGCELINDRVIISGQAVDYMQGEIFIDENS